jgi:hypothetical protein
VSSFRPLRGRKNLLGLLVAVLALGSWFAGAQFAMAGGPTSVLLASPQNGHAAALYVTDGAYQKLVATVGPDLGSTTRPAAVPHDFGGEIRLTWLIHDQRIWRIDRVYFTADDGIWIESMQSLDGGDVLAQPGNWHRAADSAGLTTILRRAGVLSTGAARAADPEPVTPPSRAAEAPAAVTQAPVTPGDTPSSPRSSWLFIATGIGGLLVGAVGSVLLLRRTSRRTAGEAENDRVVLTG